MRRLTSGVAVVGSDLISGILAVLVAVAFVPLAPVPVEAQATLKYTGLASCGGSNCHDQATPRKEFPKLNESAWWEQKDKHRKAYDTLTNEKLKSGVSPGKIAKELKIAEAKGSDRCLQCHAVNVKPELRGPKFRISEGVHCDGCHGPAETWLEPHAERGWTHEQSVSRGMYDTKSLVLRADKCVSCHLKIDHELVAAGHPDLNAFELDTFSANMPRHWGEKGAWAGTKVWAMGQVISLREAAKQLGERASGSAPQKYVDDAWKRVQGHGTMVAHLLAVTEPDAQKQLGPAVAAVADAVSKNEAGKVQAATGEVIKLMNQQAPKIMGREFDQAATQKLLQAISGDCGPVTTAGIRPAEQAAMALDRLYSTYSKAPGGTKAKPASDALNKLFADLEDPKKFEAKTICGDLQAVNKALR